METGQRYWSSYRGFNPACLQDIRLFAAVMRGEHLFQGFCNRDIRQQLIGSARSPVPDRLAAARVSRLLKRLHVHGLIAKVQRSRRWRVTRKGHALMAAILTIHQENYIHALTKPAA